MREFENKIDIRELRIGSYLKYGTFQWVIVGSVDIDNIIGFNFPETNNYVFDYIDAFEPIPITSELLERLGFEKDFSGCYWMDLYDYVVHFDTKKECSLLSSGYELPIKPQKYVHELQDLIHALTGKELTIGA